MRLRVLLSTIVVTAVLAAAPAARADNLGDKRKKANAARTQVQRQLDLALASDATVETQANQLTAEVRAQQNLLDDARRTQGTAEMEVAGATRRLAEITSRLDLTRRQLRDLAIRAYMSPPQPASAKGVADINALARGQALLSVVSANRTDLIDASRQAQHDRSRAKAAMQSALGIAAAGTKVAFDRAGQLTNAQHAQQAAHSELQKRIADLQKESGLLAAQESSIQALIATQAAAAQVALAQQSAQRQSTGSATPVVGAVSGTGLIWPVHGPVTSEFGPRWGGFHPGIDIAPPFGTPIHAAKDGVVIFAGPNGGYGNFVLIDHGGGIVTGYAHQSQLAVTQGQTVTQGQVIGYEGSTGASTGPHVHFEVRVNGATQNPRGFETGSP